MGGDEGQWDVVGDGECKDSATQCSERYCKGSEGQFGSEIVQGSEGQCGSER